MTTDEYEERQRVYDEFTIDAGAFLWACFWDEWERTLGDIQNLPEES